MRPMIRAIVNTRSSRGFTLLELLVAVAIFAVVAALAWGGLDAIVRARRVLDGEAANLARLQRALGRFDRDFSAAVPRPIRNERGQLVPALVGGSEKIEASTWQPVANAGAAGSVLQRVSWACVDGQLRRTRWAAPDRTAATSNEERMLLDKISRCRLRYVAQDGTLAQRWPLPEMPANALPRGIEFGFHLQGHGEFLRVIELVQPAEMAR